MGNFQTDLVKMALLVPWFVVFDHDLKIFLPAVKEVMIIYQLADVGRDHIIGPQISWNINNILYRFIAALFLTELGLSVSSKPVYWLALDFVNDG